MELAKSQGFLLACFDFYRGHAIVPDTMGRRTCTVSPTSVPSVFFKHNLYKKNITTKIILFWQSLNYYLCP